jgi:rare lipoprotein A (peptidoglycan hydrolase)
MMTYTHKLRNAAQIVFEYSLLGLFLLLCLMPVQLADTGSDFTDPVSPVADAVPLVPVQTAMREETASRLPACGAIHANLLQRGLASWYGPGFHGHATSSGEVYDMHQLTAAHRTLPLNTQVRVTNQRNGESVILRINDRGPYVRGRLIDLSMAAAVAIDMRDTGITPVKLEILCLPAHKNTAI